MAEYQRIRLTRKDLERVLAEFTPSTKGVEVGREPTSRDGAWEARLYAAPPRPRAPIPQGVVVFWEQGNGYVKIECDIDDRGPEGDVLTQAVDELLAALGVRRYAPPAPKPELPSLDAPKDAWFDWYHRVKDLGYKITLRDLADEWGYGYDYVRQMHAEYQGEHKEIGSTDNTH